jgi:hypothetical protein
MMRTPKKKTASSSLKNKPKKKSKAAGDELFNQVVNLTGLPGKTIRRELNAILERKNLDINSLTIDQLRAVVASYLREIMASLLERTSNNRRPHETKH